MKICGLKLTHDAAVTGIEDGRLLFHVEIEKLNNNPRYSKMPSMDLALEVMRDFAFVPDVTVIDGWKGGHIKGYDMPVASYHEFDSRHRNLFSRRQFGGYVSYPHIAGHVLGTYCTSPFAAGREKAYVITWDGGQNPRIHTVEPGARRPVRMFKVLHEFYSIIYGIMGYYYGPYRRADVMDVPLDKIASQALYGGYDKPGKLMSYIALGKADPALCREMHAIYVALRSGLPRRRLGYNQDGALEHHFMRCVYEWTMVSEHTEADVLATIHEFLKQLLVDAAVAALGEDVNLCFTGGSALNIKWNSELRKWHPKLWVPPFPNDSGSALGAACCEMAHEEKRWALDWDVYAGPRLGAAGRLPRGWTRRPITIKEVAALLRSAPVVALNGRAEIGPRALGNRSILCDPTRAENKALLNEIKGREAFRPVAPLCREESARKIFDPGTPDPYMLFDHVVRPAWRKRIPAVLHLDNTARLQTVNAQQNPLIYELLGEWEAISGVPLLCNTSANLNGAGFFPDVRAAMEWGRLRHIWSEGHLYERSV